MRLLLNTRILLWAVLTSERTAWTASSALEGSHHTILISAASARELATQHARLRQRRERLCRWPPRDPRSPRGVLWDRRPHSSSPFRTA